MQTKLYIYKTYTHKMYTHETYTLQNVYTHAAYTHKTYIHAAYTVTKRILYRTYTEHIVYSRIFCLWCSIHYCIGLKRVLIENFFLWRPQLELHCHGALAGAKFNLTIQYPPKKSRQQWKIMRKFDILFCIDKKGVEGVKGGNRLTTHTVNSN
jgi:hypothetical protein